MCMSVISIICTNVLWLKMIRQCSLGKWLWEGDRIIKNTTKHEIYVSEACAEILLLLLD